MLKGLIALVSYITNNEEIFGELFSQWEQAGFFSYLLPFLLIFALVFGVITKTNLFKDNKAINAIIALVVSLMAVQFELVPSFFSEIFPLMGMGLAVILVLFILLGFFIDPEHGAVNWILFGVGAIIFIVVISQTAGNLGWFSSGDWLRENWITLLGALIVIIMLIAIVAGSSKSKRTLKSTWARDQKD